MAKQQEKKKEKQKRPTAEKRLIQNEKRRSQNRNFKSRIRTAIRHLQDATKANDKESVQEKLNAVYSLMDKGVNRGILKKNKASRTKARLTANVAAQA